MNANEIQLLLKEQATTNQQQADALQAQFVALQLELQATKTLLQTLQGGGGDAGSLLPRSMRLDVPKFPGTDPESWIFSITEYFSLLNNPVDQRLRIVGFNLEGEAAEWFRWMKRNGLFTNQDAFVDSTVAQYQSEFEKLMNRVTDISENLLISFYVSGLKPNLQWELLVAKPTNLGDAFALARITEARLDDQRVSVVGQATTIASGGGTSKVTPKPLPIKWISPAERQERLSKGLCFNCDNRWVRGHKCPGKFLLLMADEDVEEEQPPETEHEEALESGDILILNSLVGHGSPRSLQLWGTLGTGPVHILIDNGSTLNFIQPGMVERMKLPVMDTKRFKVYIGSGETLLCENICGQVSLEMQGLCMKVDLYVLPMKGSDIVLGIQ
ncbi:ty3-gypsy retrotransposon protein, partial [Tanacetum coccineum]